MIRAFLMLITAASLLISCGGGGDDAATAPQSASTAPRDASAPSTDSSPVLSATVTTSPTVTAKPADTIDVEKDKDDAFEKTRETMRQLVDGQTARAYERIHPAQKALLTREQYAECVRAISQANKIDAELKEAYLEKDTLIPGTNVRSDSLALTIEITVDGRSDTNTYHEFKVDGNWYFAVADPEQAVEGRC